MGSHRSAAVVVIDDDPAVRDALKFLLEVAGYSVADYASAAAFLDDRTAQPACVIVDQHMLRMTGLDLVVRLRAGGVCVPILLITGSPSPAIAAQAAELRVEKVLEKPPDERELLSFVAAYA